MCALAWSVVECFAILFISCTHRKGRSCCSVRRISVYRRNTFLLMQIVVSLMTHLWCLQAVEGNKEVIQLSLPLSPSPPFSPLLSPFYHISHWSMNRHQNTGQIRKGHVVAMNKNEIMNATGLIHFDAARQPDYHIYWFSVRIDASHLGTSHIVFECNMKHYMERNKLAHVRPKSIGAWLELDMISFVGSASITTTMCALLPFIEQRCAVNCWIRDSINVR